MDEEQNKAFQFEMKSIFGLAEAEDPVAEIAKLPQVELAESIAYFYLRESLHDLFDIPLEKLEREARMSKILPRSERKQNWANLAADCNYQLEKLTTPPWFQQIGGAILLAGLILPWFFLPWGLLAFFAGIPTVYFAEKFWLGFSPATLGGQIKRTVELNPFVFRDEKMVHLEAESIIKQLLKIYEQNDPFMDESE